MQCLTVEPRQYLELVRQSCLDEGYGLASAFNICTCVPTRIVLSEALLRTSTYEPFEVIDTELWLPGWRHNGALRDLPVLSSGSIRGRAIASGFCISQQPGRSE